MKKGIIGGMVAALLFAARAEAGFLIIQQQIFVQDLQFVSASPGVNQGVNGVPKAVTVTFSAAVNPEASSLTVYDPYGNRLATGELEANGTSMSVAMPEIASGYTGVYRVQWKATCQCNNPREVSGTYYFHIR